MRLWVLLFPLLVATAHGTRITHKAAEPHDHVDGVAAGIRDMPSTLLPPSEITVTPAVHRLLIVKRAGHPPNPLWGKVTAAAVHASHGVFMAVAFVVVLPLGAMSPHLSFIGKYRLRFHIGCQLVAYALILMGFVFGLWVAVGAQDWFYDPHTQLGFCIVGLISLQPLIGMWHHLNFRRSGVRSWRYRVHTWFGRALILMGIIDGGLGLRLAGNYNRGELITYIVLSVAFFLLYVGAAVLGLLEKGRSVKVESSLPESPVTK
ncbi:hypothetical protein BR93DRAFT_968989 [Coniochaeta sp. PMI_546]|nr:hypothetical protein BR93DRAFT_968989 [Coniochaeta sp. PMI_546]